MNEPALHDPSRKLNRTIQRADIVDGVYKSSFAVIEARRNATKKKNKNLTHGSTS